MRGKTEIGRFPLPPTSRQDASFIYPFMVSWISEFCTFVCILKVGTHPKIFLGF
jgi:hypothetical protein